MRQCLVKKQFKLSPSQIQTLVTGYGSCIATDRITVDGMKVGYMYREPRRMLTIADGISFLGMSRRSMSTPLATWGSTA